MKNNLRRYYINGPQKAISFADYLFLIPHLLIARLFLYQTVIYNIPLEIQFPYLYSNLGKGLIFINVVEFFKRIFFLNIYWENSLPVHLKKNIRDLCTMWDFIPDNIDLSINVSTLCRESPLYLKNSNEIKTIFNSHKRRIRLVRLVEAGLSTLQKTKLHQILPQLPITDLVST